MIFLTESLESLFSKAHAEHGGDEKLEEEKADEEDEAGEEEGDIVNEDEQQSVKEE